MKRQDSIARLQMYIGERYQEQVAGAIDSCSTDLESLSLHPITY